MKGYQLTISIKMVYQEVITELFEKGLNCYHLYASEREMIKRAAKYRCEGIFFPFIGLSYSFMVSEEIKFKGFPLKNIAKRKQQVQRHKGNLLASKNDLDLLFNIH